MNESGSQRLMIKNGSLPINFITSFLTSVKATNSQIKFPQEIASPECKIILKRPPLKLYRRLTNYDQSL